MNNLIIQYYIDINKYSQPEFNGIGPTDVEKYSGEIVYIDNRAAITRSSSQKEEVKIVVEF